jgi:seryl-tRNA synthetase
MLDIRWIRENPEALDRALKNRGAEPQAGRLIALDEARRAAILKLEEAQARRNAVSKDIGKAMAAKDTATAERLKAEVAALKDGMAAMEADQKAAEKTLEDALAIVPNVPLDDVPVGADEHANVRYREWGKAPAIQSPKEHYELGEALKQMDFEAAAKLSGSRFTVLKKGLARLERALGQFMLDLHTEEHGYTEVQPPILVRDDAMFGTAQLPKFREDQFLATNDALFRDAFNQAVDEFDSQEGVPGGRIDYRVGELMRAKNFWLIPTAEVPLTNLVRESIVSEEELPLRFTALTPCFRSEAGAAGRDTRGMLRQHQFDKVELVSITTPEQSRDEHERMLSCAEAVLRKLDLHYRVMTLSTGDMGFASQKTYDIEVWLPGQGTYREISSCSVCGDFQARRMQARYRPRGGKNVHLVHTLNGSGVAVGRALIAVMENYQNPDGSIAVPAALRKYMNGVERIEA